MSVVGWKPSEWRSSNSLVLAAHALLLTAVTAQYNTLPTQSGGQDHWSHVGGAADATITAQPGGGAPATHTSNTHSSSGTAGSLQPLGYSPPSYNGTIPGFRVLRQVTGDHLDMQGGWYALQVDYKFPPPDPQAFLGQNRHLSCYDLARNKYKDPMSAYYQRRRAPPTPLPGGVPRVIWRWDGMITREQFDAVPDDLRTLRECMFCWRATRYQIIDGHLYRKGDKNIFEDGRPTIYHLEDMLLTVIHLFDLPDMDFILHSGAGCPPNGWPMMAWNICRGRPQAGFGMPYTNPWKGALGPLSNQAYHQCMITRYNFTGRRPVVFWRGSTTDAKFGGRLKIHNVNKVARMQAHKIAEGDPLLDTKVNRILHPDPCVQAYLAPLGEGVAIEDYAQSAVIMDIDGHGMSGRFGHRVVHYGTPVLKQASNNTAFFEHLIAPGYMAEYTKNDLSDFAERGHGMVNEWKANPERLIRQAEQLQGFAQALTHQMAVAEAMAYSLLEYSKKLTWKTVRDPSYTHVPFSQVCGPHINMLPKELCAEMQARPARP